MAFDQLYEDVDDLDMELLRSVGVWARRAGDAKIGESFEFCIQSTGQADYVHAPRDWFIPNTSLGIPLPFLTRGTRAAFERR